MTFSRADSLARAGGTSPVPWGAPWANLLTGCQAPWALGGVGPSCRQSVPGSAVPWSHQAEGHTRWLCDVSQESEGRAKVTPRTGPAGPEPVPAPCEASACGNHAVHHQAWPVWSGS